MASRAFPRIPANGHVLFPSFSNIGEERQVKELALEMNESKALDLCDMASKIQNTKVAQMKSKDSWQQKGYHNCHCTD